jgi:hypothetical protein
MKTAIKWAYAIVVLNAVAPLGLASSGWVALATGGLGFGIVPLVGPIVFLLLGLYRIYLIARFPGTLASPADREDSNWLWKIGVFLLFVGAVISVMNLMSIPVALMLGKRPYGDVPVFFMAGMYLRILGGLGILGLVLFEFARLRSFERPAPVAWR